mgnify:CR=1 FL=1
MAISAIWRKDSVDGVIFDGYLMRNGIDTPATGYRFDNLGLVYLDKNENKKLQNNNKVLQAEYKKLEKITEALANKVEQYESAVSQLKENLDKLSVANAKLLYTNRVLNSNSLNERQKDKIVDALSNAKSMEEAKTIYETLQSTVQGNNKVNAPKSLSEAINRGNSPFVQTKQNDVPPPEITRLQRLAGIK